MAHFTSSTIICESQKISISYKCWKMYRASKLRPAGWMLCRSVLLLLLSFWRVESRVTQWRRRTHEVAAYSIKFRSVMFISVAALIKM